MEDKMLKACKELLKYKGRIREEMCIKMCDECIFSFKNNRRKVCTSLTKEEATEIAQNYIKEHEKTVNTIEKIEEKNKYKVGDKVKIRYMDPDKYSEPMVDCGGDIATITNIIISQGNIQYRVKENYYYWDEDMLEPVEYKYKIGDKVRVKSDLKADIPYSRVWANHTMLEEKNEILTIEKIVGNKEYRVEENQWLWGEDMFEPVEETVTLKELQEIKNNVDHPKHYTNGKYKCIDIIEDVTKELTGLEAVCTANVIKYMWRWKLKNGVEDLKKARWYLNKLIDNTEGMAD